MVDNENWRSSPEALRSFVKSGFANSQHEATGVTIHEEIPNIHLSLSHFDACESLCLFTS